jgi:uncharacterized membrane protein YozB (DUF420 family)
MKEKNPKKSSKIKYKISIPDIIRSYFTIIAITHKNVGALRMIIAYYFLLFAFISFWFTLSVPITSEFKGGEKIVSRLISGGLTIGNLIVYGIMIAWKKRKIALLSIRIALIGFVLYLDVFLIGRIIYILIREGRFL